MTDEERRVQWREYVDRVTAYNAEAEARNLLLRERYTNMLAQVAAVKVPAKLQSFKDFMIEQLKSSMDFDCHTKEQLARWNVVQDYPEWAADTEEKHNSDVKYHAEHLAEEERRYADAVAYVDALVKTFGFEVEKR
jgi:hypothetical protein